MESCSPVEQREGSADDSDRVNKIPLSRESQGKKEEDKS